MAEYKFTIHVDLGSFKATLQRALQRATDMVTFGLWSAESVTATGDDDSMPGAFFQVTPAENLRLSFEDKKREFPRWVLANGLRDCVEALHAFLEEARQICSIWSALIGRTRMTGTEWNEWRRDEEAEARDFHEKGLPDKFKSLSAYSPTLTTPIDELILTINRARNCLVHRYGKVARKDVNSPDGLLVKWLKMELIIRGSEGERIAAPGEIVHAGEGLGIRETETSKLFRLGEHMLFSAQDFNDICMTLLRFCEALTTRVEEFGRSKGVKFTAPNGPAEAVEPPDAPTRSDGE